MMRVFCFVAILLATMLFTSGQDTDCPSTCICDTFGTSGVSAKCSALDSSQRFGLEIATLDLSDIPETTGLELTNRIFANVGLKRVSAIKIVNSALRKIDVNAFQGLHNLYDLDLTGNHLSLLEPNMFANNTHLERLSLSQNPLEFMQADPSPYKRYFLNIPSLQEIVLSGCGLSHLLPTMFANLTTLVFINLANNELREIHNETFARLVYLEEVDLSNNKLISLPSELFQNNTELTKLHLKNNPLTTVSGITIPNLQRLDLSQCNFENINSDSFAGFTHLRYLNLSGNAITNIPSDAFKLLNKLLHLDLSNNNLIGQIPSDTFLYNNQLELIKLQNNPDMRTLPENGFQGNFPELYLTDVSNCGLKDLSKDAFKGMNRMATLNMSNNNIQYLKPDTLSEKIVVLDLSHNQITYLDQISFPLNSKIKKLYLSGNPIKKLSPNDLINLSRLTNLYLKSSSLTQLWDLSEGNQTSLNNLIYLNVANNNIKSLTVKDLSYIPRVQTVILANNPITCDENLKKAVKLLVENGVASSDSTERLHSQELRSRGVNDNVDVNIDKDQIGWNSFLNSVCQEKQQFIVDPEYDNDYGPLIDDIDDNTEIIYTEEPFLDTWGSDTWDNSEVISSFPEEEIHKELIYESKTNYIWPIIIVSLSAFAIIFGLVVLAAFYLQWKRQKNSYRNRKIKRHSLQKSLTPKLLKRSTVYQQLYEDNNSPPTPVMPSKQVTEQRTYNFPDKNAQDVENSIRQPTRASYLSSPFHHSNIVPESV